MPAPSASSESPPLAAARTPIPGRHRRFGPPEGSKEERKALVKAVLDFPPVRRMIDLGKPSARYRRLLNSSILAGIKFRGVFSSFAEARANIPAIARVGYDHDEIAEIYKSHTEFVLEGDYPVMLWLREILPAAPKLLDLGGNLGITFYSFENYIPYPEDLAWTVCDLPAVIRAGRKLAEERCEHRLRFTTQAKDAGVPDVLLTSGCLMYVEQPLPEILRGLPQLPRHLLVNRTAVHPTRACVTLQNIRWMVSPYNVFQRASFVQGIQNLGYTLIDEWRDATHSCWIPFYPEHSMPAYSGFYFKRTS